MKGSYSFNIMSPAVSVVMSVYNGEAFLRESVNSILNQSFTDFEFIIVNDGSTDNSLNVLHELRDDRIKIIDNGKNKGLIYSLNLGLKEARGEYIVRMDADDISLPDRIKKQVDFMLENPDVGIAGTYVEVFGKNITKKRIMKHPVNRALNKIQLLFCPCLAHPSVIMRKSVIDKHGLIYESSYKHAEDYAFWINAIAVTEISNIPEVLLKYRVLPSSVTQQANKDFNVRFAVHKLIYTVYFRRLNLSLDDDELLLHFIVSNNERFVNHGKKIAPESIKRHLKKLYVACKYSCLFDNDCTAYYLNKRGLSLSRWYSKNKYDSLYYLIRFLYYRLKIIAK